jgi:hypothetical protein
LPATIEGSVRSGDRAADLVLAMREVFVSVDADAAN